MIVQSRSHIVTYLVRDIVSGVNGSNPVIGVEKWIVYGVVGNKTPNMPLKGMRPPGYPYCPQRLNYSYPGPIWMTCLSKKGL